MITRWIEIKNFRNIGVQSNKNRLLINANLGESKGGLIVLLGENNCGKSNVLEAINKFNTGEYLSKDKPNFFFEEDKDLSPQISLVYGLSIPTNDFMGKTFSLAFSEGCWEKLAKEKGLGEEELQEILEKDLNEGERFILRDKDVKETREEIRLILPQSKKVFLCSCKNTKYLECFSIIEKPREEVKNFDKAIPLKCSFRIDIDKNLETDNANELKQYLKENHHKKSTITPKEYKEYKEYKVESLNREAIIDEIETNLKRMNAQSQNTTWNKRDGVGLFLRILQKYKQALIKAKGLEDLENLCELVKSLFLEEKEEYNISSPDSDIFEEFDLLLQKEKCNNENESALRLNDFHITPRPQIIFYNKCSHNYDNADLTTNPEDIRESDFFIPLFKAIGQDMSLIEEAYKKFKDYSNAGYYQEVEERCNKKIKENISKKFNHWYGKEEFYNFKLRFEKNSIAFTLFRDDNLTLNLNEQSAGFRWFFNFFFRLWSFCNDEIGQGDIVLIDEVETSLSIKLKEELCQFLRDFGKQRGITFIVTTHSIHFVEFAHLDEVRIIQDLGENRGAEIINNFSILKDTHPLYPLQKALGGKINLEDKLIFVEGITDANYLNAFKEINKFSDLDFCPIGGLGESPNEGDKNKWTESNKEVARSIIKAAKEYRIKPILLVDNDEAGQCFAEMVKEEE